MESVLAHQEDMAQELKELLQKGIFSQVRALYTRNRSTIS